MIRKELWISQAMAAIVTLTQALMAVHTHYQEHLLWGLDSHFSLTNKIDANEKILIYSILLFALCSCDNFLEEDPRGKLTFLLSSQVRKTWIWL